MTGKPYTAEDEKYILKQYQKGTPPKIIAEHLGRTPEQIRAKANQLGCRRDREAVWKKWEEDFLRDHYLTIKSKEIGRILNKSERSVQSKIRRLGLKRPEYSSGPRPWTDEEKQYLLDHFGVISNKEIAEKLQRSVSAVVEKATKIGLRERTRNKWTSEEDAYLEENFYRKTAEAISKKLNRSIDSIRDRAIQIGISAYHNEFLHLSDIARAFDVSPKKVQRWHENKGMPAKQIKRGKTVLYLIDTEEFWNWAQEHTDIIPFRNYELLTLIPEPENITQLIEDDKDPSKKRSHQPITIKLRKDIEKDWARGMSYSEIEKKYGRTKESVRHILRSNHEYGI